jgi:hypothetical protein
MRTGRLLVAVAGVLLVVVGCSTNKITQGYDPNTDFSGYRTFTFYENQGVLADGIRKLIESTATRVLEKNGLERVDGEADLKIALLGGLSTVERPDAVTSTQYGYSWSGGTVGYESLSYWGLASTTQVPIGTLVVDIVDAKANRGIWRGAIKQALVDNDIDYNIELIEGAVEKLLKRFPPK